MVSSKGVKISNICLIVHKSIFGRPQFHIRINIDGKTNETVKRELAGDRVCWDEPLVLSFAEDSTNALMMSITVIETRRPFIRRTLALFQKTVEDLIQSRDQSGQPSVKLVSQSRNKSSAADTIELKFQIEETSDVLQTVIDSTLRLASGIPSSSSSGTATTVANLMSSAQNASNNYGDIWTSFLSRFQVFMSAIDVVSELNPYAKFAWAVLSLIPKTIVSQNNRNDNIRKLCEKLNDVYDYLTDSERLPKLTTTQSKALSVLLQQTIECAYFVRDYSRGTLVTKLWKGDTIDSKIQEFNEKFDHILKVITDSVSLETSIVSLRIAEAISNTEDLTLLNEMSYARDAGFISGKRCLSGTRQKLINEILDWVYNDTSRRILVLSGQAGSGKSAVAHTVAEIFEKQNRLGSLFCFNRSYKDRCNFLFSTISRNMADGDVLWRKSLVQAIQKTTARTTTDPVKQFEELIVRPAKEATTVGPVVIIVDALDESGDRRERGPILDLLFGRCSELPVNYRIVVTSRPEQDIELLCDDTTAILCKRMGDITPDETRSDIESYVSSRLNPIAPQLNKIDEHWSSVLAKRAEGLFQWAEIACRFIDPDVRHPSIIKNRWTTCVSTSSSSLYAFYHQIISSQPECQDLQFVEDFKAVVGAMIVAREPLSIEALQNIFHGIIFDIETMLKPFGSLFVGANNTSTPVRPLHTSLFDFFNDSNNNQFYIDTSDETVLTLGCLKLMNRLLCFNMCKLETSHRRNRDIPDFESRVEKVIPFHLVYACCFWVFHLRRSKNEDRITREIDILVHQNLIFFLEALSLLDKVEQGGVAMRILGIWCKDVNIELAGKAADMWQFISDFQGPITESTPHLYVSALPLTSSDSFISKQYLSRYPQVFSVEVRQTSSTSVGKASLTKKNAHSFPTRVVFSPQGNYIATGFKNGEVWIWDYLSGEMVYQSEPMKSTDQISDIVLSLNGELVYCCLCDGSIWTWNFKTNDIVHESYRAFIEGGATSSNASYASTVSSDGCYVAFYSDADKIIILYDRNNREEITRFEAIDRGLFCPRADLFAFVGPGPSIVLWNTRMRISVATWAVDRVIAGFSNNHIILVKQNSEILEIWDVQKLSKVQTVRSYIYLAALFPDGERLLSINDSAVTTAAHIAYSYTIWNISTAEKIFEGSLNSRIHCLAVSHDSQFATLITEDGTMHIADVEFPPEIENTYQRTYSAYVEPKAWLQESRLIEFYFVYPQYYFHILDIKTTKTLLKVKSEEQFPVAIPNKDRFACAAYTTDNIHSLCLWNETNGSVVVDHSDHIITAISFSAAGDRLIFSDSGGIVKILIMHGDLQAYPPTCESICPVPSTELSIATRLSFSATNTSFAVAHRSVSELVVEIRECQSGSLVAKFSKSVAGLSKGPLHKISFSHSDIFVICISRRNLTIWNTITGTERSFVGSHDHKLCSDRKLIAFQSSEGFVIWDIENEVALNHPLLDLPVESHLVIGFSNDSACMVVVHTDPQTFDNVYIWELHTNKWTTKSMQRSLYSVTKVALCKNHLFIGRVDSHGGVIENLDVYKDLMRLMYEHHQNNSQFGMYPEVDYPGVEQLIETFNKSVLQDDIDTEVSEYALTAWRKGLFSASSCMDEQGWVLGPHNELLFWIPKERREGLWRPCMAYSTLEHYTKLYFDKFVHGSRWTECRENSDI